MSRCRIINGRLKRSYIEAPKTNLTRPTSDIVKQSLFNILLHRIRVNFEDCCVIDLFAGSGSLGIEAISLGCENTLFVDSNLIAIKTIQANLEKLKIEGFAKVSHSKAENIPDSFLQNFAAKHHDIIIFLDPPYINKNLLLNQIFRLKSLFYEKHIVIIVESDSDIFAEHPNLVHKTNFGIRFISILEYR